MSITERKRKREVAVVGRGSGEKKKKKKRRGFVGLRKKQGEADSGTAYSYN